MGSNKIVENGSVDTTRRYSPIFDDRRRSSRLLSTLVDDRRNFVKFLASMVKNVAADNGKRFSTIVDATSTLCKSTSTLFDVGDDRRRNVDVTAKNVDEWRQSSTPKKNLRRSSTIDTYYDRRLSSLRSSTPSEIVDDRRKNVDDRRKNVEYRRNALTPSCQFN